MKISIQTNCRIRFSVMIRIHHIKSDTCKSFYKHFKCLFNSYIQSCSRPKIGYNSDLYCQQQCFGSIFIESGSSQKSQSGSGSKRTLNPDLIYFFIIITFFHQVKNRMLLKSHKKVKLCFDYLTFLTFSLAPGSGSETLLSTLQIHS